MEIEFDDPDLERVCCDQRTASRRFGAACARRLQARLADLFAAESVGEIVAGRPHPLKGDRHGQFSVSLDGGRRLVFAPNHGDATPTAADGSIAWASVTRVRVVFIGDYHD
jgi:proteic killer suppression protein